MLVRRTAVAFALLSLTAAPAVFAAVVQPPAHPAPEPSRLSVAAIRSDPKLLGETEQNPKLSSDLTKLAAIARAARLEGRSLVPQDFTGWPENVKALVDTRRLRMDAAGRVQIYVQAEAAVAEAEAAVQHAGGQVERSSADAMLVQARLSPEGLEALAADSAVRFVRLPDYGYPQVGSVTTAGDRLLEASVVRSTFGVNGAGIRVGVMSDGVAGLSSAQSTGDLGSVNTTTCNVAGGNPGPEGAAEGTAMLEIVHDLAPGAQLFFGHQETTLDFNAAVVCLAQNVDVISDDISFFNVGPYDGTNLISINTSSQLNKTSNRLRAYATSVGNQAVEHYAGKFRDSGFIFKHNNITYTVHQFAGGGATTDAGQGLSCDGSGNAPFCGNTINIEQNASFTVFLQWDSPFSAAHDDYDMFLLDGETGDVVAASTNVQNGHQEPTEQLSFTNHHPARQYIILIGLRSGAARNLSLFVPACSDGACDSFANGTDLNFNTEAGSVPAEGDAGGGVLSVGAINAANPHNVDIEFFSSHGPTADGRNKPDITAIDGVAVSGADGFSSPFFGTSAASPHVAGIAALLLQLGGSDLLKGGSVSPAVARGFIHDVLLAGAIFLGDENVFGAGRIAALPSARLVLLPAAEPCVASGNVLCFDDSPGDRRFRAEVVFDTGTAQVGDGNAIGLSSLGVTSGGLFWFFGASNPEMLFKVLNGCGVDDDFWVFYAAGTNVNLSVLVTDTQAESTLVYSNPGGFAALPVQDTSAFPCNPSSDSATQSHRSPRRSVSSMFAAMRSYPTVAAARPSSIEKMPEAETSGWVVSESHIPNGIALTCENTATTLCIDGRYQVTVAFGTATQSGNGAAIPLSSLGVQDGGLFWFFSPTNPEMLIKVVNGCGVNNHNWLFFSAGTDAGLTVEVLDFESRTDRSYQNPLGVAAFPVQDTSAFPCP